jgi:hypothetical protein
MHRRTGLRGRSLRHAVARDREKRPRRRDRGLACRHDLDPRETGERASALDDDEIRPPREQNRRGDHPVERWPDVDARRRERREPRRPAQHDRLRPRVAQAAAVLLRRVELDVVVRQFHRGDPKAECAECRDESGEERRLPGTARP